MDAIEAVHRLLTGERIRNAGYICQGLFGIAIGDDVDCKTISGKDVRVAKYVIHIECPWRLRDRHLIVSGIDDKKRDDGVVRNWAKTEPRIVHVEIGAVGDASIHFSDNKAFDILPCGESLEEDGPAVYWRLMVSGGPHDLEERQIMSTGVGIQIQDDNSDD